MIRALRGALLDDVRDSDEVARVALEESGDEMDLEVLDVPGPLGAGTSVCAVEARVPTGARDRRFRVLVGPEAGADAVSTGAGGLRMTPVVLAENASRDLVAAGAGRAGKGARIEILSASQPALGARMLRCAARGFEILLVTGGDRRTLELVRVLEGRPVPVAPLWDVGALRRLLTQCRVEVDVPVPVLESDERERTWAWLRSTGIDRAHHLVEVDPRPAFDELGLDPAAASLGDRAAAAAGVLAGRLAAANRGWRSAFE